jgi:EpsI family protein
MNQPFRLAISIALVVGAAALVHLRSPGQAVSMRKSLGAFPTTLGRWQAREGTVLDPASLRALKAHEYLMRRDEDRDGHSVWLFVGYWATRQHGAQPHSPRNCLPGSGWEPLDASTIRVRLPSAHPAAMTVNRYLIQKDREQQLVLYWYQSQGVAIADELQARIRTVRSSIWDRRTDSALIRVSSPIRGDLQDVSGRLIEYVQTMYPTLREYLPE